MPELIAPTAGFHEAWLQAHREWGPGQHEDGFGLSNEDEVETAEGFAIWIRRLVDQSDLTVPVGADHEHCTYRWIVEGNELLGGIALRHEFTDFVARMGHIGYGVRPSARRRGLATWALGHVLDEAKVLGLERVLIVCGADNFASAKVIENHGGILDEAPDVDHRRYWIQAACRPIG